MSKEHTPTKLILKELLALKHQAQIFKLPNSHKKSEIGFGSTYSPFKSHGLDFQEVRVYQPGDDIRQIDWHVTAKYGKPFTKLYTEEKERAIFFVVDLRSSMNFATHGDFKSVIAGRLATFMAFIAEQQHDKIGYLILSDNGLITSGDSERYNMVTPFLNTMINPPKTKQEATFQNTLKFLETNLKNGSFVFVFSDFNDWTPTITKQIVPIVEKSTLLLCPIYDMLETMLPNDTLPFSNGIDCLTIPQNNDRIRQKFHQEWASQMQTLEQDANKYGWGLLPIKTDEDYINKICHFCFQGGTP